MFRVAPRTPGEVSAQPRCLTDGKGRRRVPVKALAHGQEPRPDLAKAPFAVGNSRRDASGSDGRASGLTRLTANVESRKSVWMNNDC